MAFALAMKCKFAIRHLVCCVENSNKAWSFHFSKDTSGHLKICSDHNPYEFLDFFKLSEKFFVYNYVEGHTSDLCVFERSNGMQTPFLSLILN